MIYYLIVVCTVLPKLIVSQTESSENVTLRNQVAEFPADDVQFKKFEMLLPNGEIYSMPFNPAFRKLRGIPSRSISIPEKQVGRVVGGILEARGNMPYQVGLMLKNFGLVCGGSIYRKDTIISAAHCFFENGQVVPSNEFLVVAGKSALDASEQFEQLRTVKEVIMPDDFSYTTPTQFDIALVILKEPLCFNPHVQPIPIPAQGFTPGDGESVNISGWGYTLARKSNKEQIRFEHYSKTLKSATLRIISRNKCMLRFINLNDQFAANIVNHDTVLCAGLKDEAVDACQGDSGGPLTCVDLVDETRFLCGIISTGIGCAQPNIPSLYTNVGALSNWILQHAGTASEPCLVSDSTSPS